MESQVQREPIQKKNVSGGRIWDLRYKNGENVMAHWRHWEHWKRWKIALSL